MILMMGGDGDDEMLDPKWDIDIVPSKADGDNLNWNSRRSEKKMGKVSYLHVYWNSKLPKQFKTNQDLP